MELTQKELIELVRAAAEIIIEDYDNPFPVYESDAVQALQQLGVISYGN